jgi:hypothetical protein
MTDTSELRQFFISYDPGKKGLDLFSASEQILEKTVIFFC